jgi:hypothetical protein
MRRIFPLLSFALILIAAIGRLTSAARVESVGEIALVLWWGGRAIVWTLKETIRQARKDKEDRNIEKRWALLHHFQARVCPICGYSLIGNVSGTCPECGTKLRDLIL